VSGIIDSLSQFMSRLVESFGYAGLLLVMLIENVIPPIPSEVVLPFAGFQVAEGTMNLVLVLLVTTVGGFAGTSLFYYLGKLLGDTRVRQLIRRFGRYVLLREADYDEALTLFHRHDSKVVFWARFIPGVRSLISLPAGVAGMSFRRFAVFTVAGTVLWNSALVLAGVFLGSRWERVLDVVDRIDTILWVLLGLVVVGWFVWQRSTQARRRAARAANGGESTD
jgi:membrane protein DedA with SNARE-associated domain